MTPHLVGHYSLFLRTTRYVLASETLEELLELTQVTRHLCALLPELERYKDTVRCVQRSQEPIKNRHKT